MALTARTAATIGVGCAIALVAAATVGFSAPAEAPTVSSDQVELAPTIAAWPSSYTVTATKSEPGYVEHITSTRDGDRFALEIVIEAQGTGAGGSSLAEVVVGPDGTIRWTNGCVTNCDDDEALRGFLAAASLLSAARQDALPASAVARQLGDHHVVCISDDDLFPATAGSTVARLDPCFSAETGAVLGHYSDVNGAFVGPTMSPTSITETLVPETRLFTTPPL